MSNTKIKASQFHGVVGHGTDGYFLMTNADGSMSWSQASTGPSVTSVTYPGDDTAADPAGGQTVVLTGTGFAASGMTVTIGGTTAPSVAHDSNTQLTITTPAKAAGDYDIVVTNSVTGASGTFVNGISYNGVPTWTTAAGSLGTFESETTISTITLQATEPDGGTITFNITNGALPTGLSLTGANIDGTTTAESSTTLYSFTIEAIDDENQSTPRNFSITVNAAELVSSENFTINTYTGNGSTQSIEGKIGTAAKLTSSSSDITAPILSEIDGDASVSVWLKSTNTTTTGRAGIIELNTGGSPGWAGTLMVLYRYSDGEILVRSGNGVSSETDILTHSNTSLRDGSWHHLVVTRNQTTGVTTLYIDGTQADQETVANTSSVPSSGGTKIGCRYAGSQYFWDGSMDQVRLFNKALSSSEVTTLYGEPNTLSTKSTTDIFDDGSGVALYEFEKGAIDTGGVTGYIGSGGIFNGSSYISNINLGNNLSNGFSYSFWMNLPSVTSGVGRNLYFNDGTDSEYFFMYLNAGIMNVVSSVFSSFNGNTTLTANTWNHIVLTGSTSENIKLYLNGSLEATSGSSLTALTLNTILTIGADRTFANKMIGKLDQVRIFNKALSSSEVTTLYGETSASATKSTTDIFDDGSGVALYELEGNANDTGRGAIDSGQSAVFNGSNGYIDLGSNFSLLNSTQNLSMSLWFNTTSNGRIFGSEYSNSYFPIEINCNTDGTVYLAVRNSGGTPKITSSTTFNNGSWHHLVGIVNVSSNLLSLYINNTLIGTTSVGGSGSSSQKRFIGGEGGSFNGKIDQIRIYSSVLSASDVEALMSETNVPTNNLVAHYKLDGNANDETTTYNGTAYNLTYSDPAEFPTYDGTATNVSYAYDGTPTNVSFVGTSFQPDLVWIKPRSIADNHNLFDSIRGATKQLISNNTSAESTQLNTLTSFNSNGFTTGSDNNTNTNGATHVAWCWKAGGTAVSNTDGTLTSQVSANQDAGFSIVKTSNTAGEITFGHGLSQAPELIINKGFTSAGWSWLVYHKDAGTGKYLKLNSSDAVIANAGSFSSVTSTTITNNSSNSTSDYINYCFHSVDGYQKIGSYTGTGSAGNKQTTGFAPRFVMIKPTSTTGSWAIVDSVRPNANYLFADSSAAETTSTFMNLESDGFSFAGATGNDGSVNFIYLAIA